MTRRFWQLVSLTGVTCLVLLRVAEYWASDESAVQ